MEISRLQPREGQDKQSDQTHRDASPNENQGVRDFWELHCRQHEIQQRSKGKELALVEEKASLNEVVIGEDGKPVDILSECYDKDHPGLAGGAGNEASLATICDSLEAMLDVADKLTMDPASKLVVEILKAAMQKRVVACPGRVMW